MNDSYKKGEQCEMKEDAEKVARYIHNIDSEQHSLLRAHYYSTKKSQNNKQNRPTAQLTSVVDTSTGNTLL